NNVASHCAPIFGVKPLPVPVWLRPHALSLPFSPVAIVVTGAAMLVALFALVYFPSRAQDPLFCVFSVFSFTSVIDLIIALEEDDYLSGFMEFYMQEVTGGGGARKFGSELRPAFLLNVPYLLIPIWVSLRLFRLPRSLPGTTVDKVAKEQGKGLHQRPLDVALVLYLLLAGAFTLFRGLVALDCPADSCFNYIYQQEPYLRDPVAYPRVQMLVNLFYFLPFFCLCLYGLLFPGCTWMPDWALVFAGAVAQAQFSHVGSSLHRRTPYPYRTPEGAWWPFLLANGVYALGPQLLAYRCLRSPGFFCPPARQDADKKHQ
uniref:Transmembrane 6 superfamily member 2 n=1 Tax=Sphenodon punctatus TaxID=8508 RepID=A0A8D0GV91_SPHPU